VYRLLSPRECDVISFRRVIPVSIIAEEWFGRGVCVSRLLYQDVRRSLLWPVEPVVRLHRVSQRACSACSLSSWLVDGCQSDRQSSTLSTSASRRHLYSPYRPQPLHSTWGTHLIITSSPAHQPSVPSFQPYNIITQQYTRRVNYCSSGITCVGGGPSPRCLGLKEEHYFETPPPNDILLDITGHLGWKFNDHYVGLMS